MTDTAKATEYIVAETNPARVVEVTADIGNARSVVLVREAESATPTAVTMPSIRSLHGAFSYELFAARGLAAGSWSKLRSGEHVLERDGTERYVGALAAEFAPAASSGRGSDARYSDGTTLDFILAGIAAALPGATKIAAKLTTMLPISLYHLAPGVVAALRGTHRYTYNGRAITLTIGAVEVKREGEAAFAAIDGDTSGNVVLVDVGGRTANVALFKDGTYRTGATLELGVQAALDNLDKALIGRGLRPLSLTERDELEAALIAGRDYSIVHAGASVRVDDIARGQLDTTAHALAQELQAKVKLDQAARVVCVGGGAHPGLFGNVLRQEIKRLELPGLRELANAYGAMGTKKATKKR
jgi:hypothetical protein